MVILQWLALLGCNYFIIYVSDQHIVHLQLHSVLCQIYLNKAGEKIQAQGKKSYQKNHKACAFKKNNKVNVPVTGKLG